MALPDPKSHRISLEEAVAQAKRYRENMTKGGLYLRKDVDDLLAQPGCAALRFYYGRTPEGRDTVILVGSDEKGSDMTNGVLLEFHFD
ncbi:MAG TPA: hypothetical protein VGP87_02355, partial [Gemmatimonadales bacterium]|nr:hypothetical protein [Gemmatimonadales bacterium]